MARYLDFEEVSGFLSPVFEKGRVRLFIRKVDQETWEVAQSLLDEGEEVNEELLAIASDAHRATVPLLRHVASHGIRITQADREDLGQWSVWAQAGVPERMHERGW